MKEENKRCWNCRSYAAFYTREKGSFCQEKIGTCRKHDKIVEKQEVCENWTLCQPKSRRLAHVNFGEILQSLAELEQILKEESELENNLAECYLTQE